MQTAQSLRTIGLFAGIGGIELGLQRHGHTACLLSEIEPHATVVLSSRFPKTKTVGDIRNLKKIPTCDLISAGFPCQDLSQCGQTRGIKGQQSSLVTEVFRLVDAAKKKPNWLLLENVPFMLRLDRGRAMEFITSELSRLGYCWAYRTVDARAFGLPQRRLRVVLLASLNSDPREVLFADENGQPTLPTDADGYGFYWTEGATGLGWGVGCVPTLKGGSGLGIPSPPAIWFPRERRIATIDIRDAERLQGFPSDWTKPAEIEIGTRNKRWNLIGNAVCVRVSEWIGRRLAKPGKFCCVTGGPLQINNWPQAAFGNQQSSHEIIASSWPCFRKSKPIVSFLRFPTRPLSERATAGFLQRARNSSLRFHEDFLDDVENHLNVMRLESA